MATGDYDTPRQPVHRPPGQHRMEQQILLRLLEYCDDIDEWPWRTIEEVVGGTDDPIVALDALFSLWDKHLIRRQGEQVMASSVVYSCYQLISQGVSDPSTA